jgi:S1-C subfamily serine protease
MRLARRFLSTAFGSALTGGLVVAVAGLIAIGAGWIEGNDEGSPPLAQPAPTRPVAADWSEELTVGEIYRRDNDGVVYVRAEVSERSSSPFGPLPQEQRSTATGSGFVIDDEGHILTNAHVVEGASKVEVQIGDSEQAVDATVAGSDPSTDVALLDVDVDPDQLHPLQLGDPGQLQVGDPVVAIGNPYGLDRTVTSGIVSALQRQIQAPNGFAIDDVIQTDAAINPGNSGGPLIDSAGRVVGINSQIASSSGGSQGVGFAVPIDTAQDVADQILEDGEVQHAYLGISGADVTPDAAGALDLPVERGAMVAEAFDGGPAADAGIRGASGQASIDGEGFPTGGDIIVAVDGQSVSGMDEVSEAVDSRRPGDEITLTIVRDGERQDVRVELGTRPNQIRDASGPSLP